MKGLSVAVAFMTFGIAAFSQKQTSNDSTKYYYDTVKTICNYVTDLDRGIINSGYCVRVVKSKMDFMQPTVEDVKKDSFTVKKNKIPVTVEYFIPIAVMPKATKQNKSPKPLLNYVKIPNELILNDFNVNFDHLLQKEQPVKK